MKWKEKLTRNRWQLAVLVLVLLVQCFYISQKDGYHMDELLTFELANAEYNPWIVPTQPVGRLAKFMQQEIYADSLGETLGNLRDTVVDVLQNRGAVSCSAIRQMSMRSLCGLPESNFMNISRWEIGTALTICLFILM